VVASVLSPIGFHRSHPSLQMLLLSMLFGLTSITSCGTGRATLLGFDSQPSTPLAGDNVSLWVAYTSPGAPVTNGTATYTVTLNGIPLPKTVDPLCDQTSCPKDSNTEYNETSWSIFPSGISGKVVSRIQWADQDAAPLWCIETTWRVSDE
jgi:hypothetical protein